MSVIQLILLDTNKKAKWVLLSLLALLSLSTDCCIIYQLPLPFPASPTTGLTTIMAANHSPGAPSSSWHLALQEVLLGDLSVEPCIGGRGRGRGERGWQGCNIAKAASSLPYLAGDDLVFCQDSIALCLCFHICKMKILRVYTSKSQWGYIGRVNSEVLRTVSDLGRYSSNINYTIIFIRILKWSPNHPRMLLPGQFSVQWCWAPCNNTNFKH